MSKAREGLFRCVLAHFIPLMGSGCERPIEAPRASKWEESFRYVNERLNRRKERHWGSLSPSKVHLSQRIWNHVLGVGEKFPSFSLTASVGIEQDPATAFKVTTDLDYGDKWKVYFFWPRDFSPACATDIVGFAKLHQQFQEQGAQILGGSIDSEWAHCAWRESQPELNDLAFPMLADIKRELCGRLGILDSAEGVPQRATFIVDPSGVIQFVCVLAGPVERNADEVLRVLRGLHSIHVRAR